MSQLCHQCHCYLNLRSRAPTSCSTIDEAQYSAGPRTTLPLFASHVRISHALVTKCQRCVRAALRWCWACPHAHWGTGEHSPGQRTTLHTFCDFAILRPAGQTTASVGLHLNRGDRDCDLLCMPTGPSSAQPACYLGACCAYVACFVSPGPRGEKSWAPWREVPAFAIPQCTEVDALSCCVSLLI